MAEDGGEEAVRADHELPDGHLLVPVVTRLAILLVDADTGRDGDLPLPAGERVHQLVHAAVGAREDEKLAASRATVGTAA